jgi:NlpC/P60 family
MTSPIDTTGLSPILDEGKGLVHFSGLGDLTSGISPMDSPFGHLLPPDRPPEPNTVPGQAGFMPDVKGKVSDGLQAAMRMLGTPYVWGGSSAATGVDCSGLVYLFLRGAGAQTSRYRAADYGHMGQAVDQHDARPGDIVYFDEPGATDHVGIYLGNGLMLQSPQTGDVVKISPVGHATSFRRLLPDTAWGGMPIDPNGNFAFQHGNTVYRGGWRADY